MWDDLGTKQTDCLQDFLGITQGATKKDVVDPQTLHLLQVADTILRAADHQRFLQLLCLKATIPPGK